MSQTSIVSTGRPQTTDLRALDPSVSPLDAFELDTTNPDAPLLKMTNGWTIDKANTATTATTAATANNALALDASYIPSLTECIDPDPTADSVIIYDASARKNKKLKQGLNSAPPIGFVYWQLPGKSAPGDLYPGTTWDNVSDEFAGNFFRAEGGNASAFGGGEQAHMFQTHAHNHRHGFKYNDGGSLGPAANTTSSIGTGYTLYDASGPSSGSYGAETRPTNRTIRIWERIA